MDDTVVIPSDRKITADKNAFVCITEEAKVVKRIFEMYLSGMGVGAIAKRLINDSVPSLSGKRWRTATIYGILRDEKYIGNLLLQKTYRVDYLTKRKAINRGELPQYLVTSAHEPIIDEITFNKAQEEIARREKQNHLIVINAKSPSNHKGPKGYRLFTGIIKCAHCHTSFIYKAIINTSKREIWVCNDYLDFGKTKCPNKAIPETILIEVTTDVLLSHKLIKKDSSGNLPELTHDLLTRLITKIIAYKDQALEYHLADGEIVTTKWQFKSRRESWTPEMKERARIKALEIIAKRKKEELSNTVETETSKPAKSHGVAERSEK